MPKQLTGKGEVLLPKTFPAFNKKQKEKFDLANQRIADLAKAYQELAASSQKSKPPKLLITCIATSQSSER
jgi:hypothetical protein